MGYNISTSTNGDFMEYSFLGTGVEIAMNMGTNYTLTVQIDGVAYTGAATISPTANGTWTPGTSTWTANAGNGTVLQITGLSYGMHKIRVTRSSGTGAHTLEYMNVVTPVFAYKNLTPENRTYMLPLGETGISDLRKRSPIRSEDFKNVYSYTVDSLTSNPTTTSAVYVPIPQQQTNLVIRANKKVRVIWGGSLQNNTAGAAVQYALYIDGMPITSNFVGSGSLPANTNFPCSLVWKGQLAPGNHRFEIYWLTNTGTATAVSGNRMQFLVEETD
jgi:hypothetical protein